MRAVLYLVMPLAIVPEICLAQNVDEIIVTTQKRLQSIKDVPLAITAYGSEQLETLGIEQFDDLSNFVPGLEVQEQSANNPGFVIRGITSDSGEATIEPRISIYQDGVSISRSRGSFVEIFDSQIEVVRGPQPTLFGRSALIGAINVTSHRPEFDETSANVRFGYGNLNSILAEGVVNVPLNNRKIAARAAVRYKKRDGYIDNTLGEDLNGYETYAGRLSVGLEPTENLDVTLIASLQSDDNSGTAFKSGTFSSELNGSTSAFEPASLSTFDGLHGGRDLGVRRDISSLTGKIEYGLGNTLSLTSVTNYRQFDSYEVFDPDGFSYELFSFAEIAQGNQFSQELRLNFDQDGKFAGFVGGSYFKEEGFQRTPLGMTESIAQALLGGFLFTNLPGIPQNPAPMSSLPTVNVNPASPLFGAPLGVHTEQATNYGDTQSWDLFADISYALTDRLEVSAGLRYTNDDKISGYDVDANKPSNLTGVGVFLGTGTVSNGKRIENSDSFDGLTWRLAANFDLTKNLTLFGNYARGRRPEVIAYNFDANDLSVFATGELADSFERLKAENVNAYEVGFKGQLLNGRLNGDLFTYIYDYSNFQSSVINTDTGQTRPINAGNASAFGIENTLNFKVSETIELFSVYAYTNATFDKTDGQGNLQEFAGNRFRLTPEHAFTVGAIFSHALQKGSLSFTPIYAWKSKVFFNNDNDLKGGIQDEFQSHYGVLDLKLSYAHNDSHWKLEAFIKNVLDKEYLLDAGNVGGIFGIPTFVAAAPRTYGVTFSKSF